MQTRSLARYVVLALAATVLATLPALADPARLVAGDPFAPVEAESASRKHVALPADLSGKPFVAIFAFSRKAGDASSKWSDALYKALPPSVAIYAVADLSRVPGLFRGFVVSAIRKEAASMEPEDRDHLLLLTRENAWSKIVPSGSDDDAVIVAVDQAGAITDIERRAFSDAAADDVAKTIANRP